MSTNSRTCRLAAGIVLTAAMAAFAQLLNLQNASFEDPDDPENPASDRADGWGRWGHWINRETAWAPTYDGTCLIGYHHWEISENDNSGVYQDVQSVPADREVTFSIQTFKDEGTNAEEVELRIEPFGGGDALASQRFGMGDIPAGRWKLISVTGTSPASGGLRLLVIVSPKMDKGRNGALKFDDASLTFGGSSETGDSD